MSTTRTRQILPAIGLALIAALLVLLYRDVFAYFIPRWFQEAPYRHCPLVPLIVVWLIWRKRKELAGIPPAPSIAGLLLLALGLLVYIAGGRTGVRLIMGASLPLVLLGLAAALMGGPRLRLLTIPLLLTFFLIPAPRHVLGHVAFPMQIVSARASAALGRITGLSVTSQGVLLDLDNFKFEVAQECSGLNSLLALLLASGVLVEIMELPLGRKLLVMAVAPIIVLAANIVRLLSVLWISKFVGPKFALDSLIHGTSDIIVYSMAVVFVLLLIGFVGGLRLGPSPASSAVAEQG